MMHNEKDMAGRDRERNKPKIIRIRDFSVTPGVRYRCEGSSSGEEFRESCLVPLFKEAGSRDQPIRIEFDGTMGYPTSFLEEAFGGLIRRLPNQADEVLRRLELVPHPTRPQVVKLAKEYMQDAYNKLK